MTRQDTTPAWLPAGYCAPKALVAVLISRLLSGLLSRVVIGLLSCLTPALADQELLQHLYSPSLPIAQQPLQDKLEQQVQQMEFTQALALSQSLLDRFTASRLPEGRVPKNNVTTRRDMLYGMLMVNHGILQIAAQDPETGYDQGLVFIEQGLGLMATQLPVFSPDLRPALIVKGLTQTALSQYALAEDSFRHAQHITHRHQGVYSPQQIPTINHITRTQLRRKQTEAADREQLFSLFILEQVHGTESPALASLLNNLGMYFAHRGKFLHRDQRNASRQEREFLFKRAIALLERAVMIIEQHFGAHDLQLMQPLQNIAKTRIWQDTNKKQAQEVLERSLGIVLADPNADPSDKAMAMVELGDMYIMAGHKKAADTYLEAWHLLQATPTSQQLAEQLFGTPQRLPLQAEKKLYLSRRPDNASEGEAIFATLEYSVTEKGKVEQLVAIDNNLPNEQVRLLKTHLRTARFRPRIVAGEVVLTEGLVLRQLYGVLKKVAIQQEN